MFFDELGLNRPNAPRAAEQHHRPNAPEAAGSAPEAVDIETGPQVSLAFELNHAPVMNCDYIMRPVHLVFLLVAVLGLMALILRHYFGDEACVEGNPHACSSGFTN